MAEAPLKSSSGGPHADYLAAAVASRSAGAAGLSAGLAASMVGAVLFTGVGTGFASLSAQFAKGSAKWRISRHE